MQNVTASAVNKRLTAQKVAEATEALHGWARDLSGKVDGFVRQIPA